MQLRQCRTLTINIINKLLKQVHFFAPSSVTAWTDPGRSKSEVALIGEARITKRSRDSLQIFSPRIIYYTVRDYVTKWESRHFQRFCEAMVITIFCASKYLIS